MLQDSWNIRIWQEYLDCINAGGAVIFATFTYNDFCLPRYYYTDLEGNKDWFPCFSKRDRDRFLNSIRKRWEKAGFTGKNTCYSFKSIWANEYGTTVGCTHRPHYHVQFFIPPEIMEYESKECMKLQFKISFEDYWKRLLQSYWTVPHSSRPLGMVMWTPGESIFVNSEFASLYCSKYMFKSDTLLLNERVQKYLKDFGTLPPDGKCKGSFTSHWQSLHFGESLVKRFDDVDTYINGVNFNLSSELKKGKVIRHKIPMYIERKILYDYSRDDNRYILNEKGVEFKRKKFFSKLDKLCGRYKRYFDKDFLKSLLGDFDFKSSKSILKNFENFDDLSTYITSILTFLYFA